MTRALLLAAVALAVHVALGLVVHAHPGPLGVDRAAYDVLAPVVGATGKDVMRVFTDVGSFPVVVPMVLITAVLAVRAGRTDQAALLVAGALLALVLDDVAKGIWDRPRPTDRFYDPAGLSFPSGHSTQAITFVAAASISRRRSLVAAAVVLALAIGLSRLYLHVHYLTDVLGGFALGTALFAPLLTARR